MNVRIIAGKYGGRTIDAPDRRSTHAMGERIRNAIFNSLGEEVKGAIVLDAFAGSGSVGIEALSRGAKECLFIEKERVAVKIIQNNLELLKIDNAGVLGKMVGRWIGSYKGPKFDIIFADPPYHDTQIHTLIRLFGLMSDNGCMVISLPSEQEMPAYADIKIVSERVYGNAKIVMIRWRDSK